MLQNLIGAEASPMGHQDRIDEPCEALERALIAAADRLEMSDTEADRLERALQPRLGRPARAGRRRQSAFFLAAAFLAGLGSSPSP
jgi:hypothetical protein